MIRLNKEKIKTWLLIVLIAGSLIQIGIHLNQQGQGFPIRFITQIFKSSDIYSSIEFETVRQKYFVPESLIVSRGPTASKWKINEGDTHFTKIWDDINNNYLPQIIGQKPEKILPKEDWPEITSVRCIQLNFSVNWPSEIVLWFENKKPSISPVFNSIKSIAILPSLDVNKSINTICIYDGNQVYQYTVNIKGHFLTKKFYIELADQLSFENKPEYDNLSELGGFKASEDILVPVSIENAIRLPILSVKLPEEIKLNVENLENESIQDSILLAQKDSLMAKYNENTGQVIFTDTDNLYRLFDDGIVEYRYLPVNNAPAGDVSTAFGHAISFIESRRRLLGDTDIVLTNIEKSEKYYEMHFDYKYKGIPVFYTSENSKKTITSPLIIRANDSRVLECRWVIRSITEKRLLRKYRLEFSVLVNKLIPSNYPEIMKAGEDLFFKRMEPGYIFDIDSKDNELYSHWIISDDTKDYFIPVLGDN
ncbi:MAG: hypothetical protein GX957_05590 [Clostridiaceae bacterium]|nr:hypothetical protein [Clostridiaceae bacterium]